MSSPQKCYFFDKIPEGRVKPPKKQLFSFSPASIRVPRQVRGCVSWFGGWRSFTSGPAEAASGGSGKWRDLWGFPKKKVSSPAINLLITGFFEKHHLFWVTGSQLRDSQRCSRNIVMPKTRQPPDWVFPNIIPRRKTTWYHN